jgi:hypothetical protein
MATNQLLSHVLTSPSKVASALDWKKASGSVLSLKVGRDSLSWNLAHHPSLHQDCQSFDPVPIKYRVRNNRKVLETSVTEILQDIIQDKKVCGFVVDWPLQKEGRMGASCGRVLHILDSLLEASVLSQHRKFCLWGHGTAMETEDKWGRCSVYGRKCCDKTEHIASRDQYTNTTSSSLVEEMWDDFSRTHWPELYERQGASATCKPSKDSRHHAGEWLKHFEREGTYLQASSTIYDRRMIAPMEKSEQIIDIDTRHNETELHPRQQTVEV